MSQVSEIRRVNVAALARLDSFSHAVVVDRQVHVSGMLGTEPSDRGGLRLAEGGAGAQTRRALANLAMVLTECGCAFVDVLKVNVYLVDMDELQAMDEVYRDVLQASTPARVTVGVNALALGAAVEIDCIAYLP